MVSRTGTRGNVGRAAERPAGEEVTRRTRSALTLRVRVHFRAPFAPIRIIHPDLVCRSTRMEASRGPILFRCDGTFDKGWEPFYQCLSLAAALQRRRRGTHFFSYLDPLSLATVINRANNDWVAAEQPLGSP